MYSGGDGYYWLIDQIGQQSSYFCLQNNDWQFIAMDTGHNDHNPLTRSHQYDQPGRYPRLVGGQLAHQQNSTGWNSPRRRLLAPSALLAFQLSWHNEQASSMPTTPISSRTFRVSSRKSTSGSGATNILSPSMIPIWASCADVASVLRAVPVFTNQQQYAAATGLQTYQNASLPTWNPSAILGDNGTDYNNAFAIIDSQRPHGNRRLLSGPTS